MAEYRHITNIKGPSAYQIAINNGFTGSEEEWVDVVQGNPVSITPAIDIDELKHQASYRLDWTNYPREMGIPSDKTGRLDVIRLTNTYFMQRYTTRWANDEKPEVLTRGMDSDRNYLPDWEIQEELDSSHPSARIKDLARRDGWLAVYDPTDPTTTEVHEGKTIWVRDGLKNVGALGALEEGKEPTHLPGEFGSLAGMGGDSGGSYIRGFWNETVPQPLTFMVLARDSKPRVDSFDERRFLLDSRAGYNRNAIFTRPYGRNDSSTTRPAFRTNTGRDSHSWASHDTRPHLFRMTSDGEGDAPFTIDEEYQTANQGSESSNGITLGQMNTGGNYWQGTFGVALVYAGDIPQEKVNRMSRLIMSLAGIPQSPPSFDGEVSVYGEDEHGVTTFSHGDPDEVKEHFGGIASITKVMTLWTARKHLSSSDMDNLVEVVEADNQTTARIRPGDLVSYRDLFYLSAVPSDNTAPHTIARTVGQIILDDESGTGDPFDRFISEMNAEAQDLGYEGSEFTNPQTFAEMSPRQVVDLFRRSMADQVMRDAFSAMTHTVDVQGPDSRTVNITHTVQSNEHFLPPGYIAGKTGTRDGWGHLVALWEHPDGSEHCTVSLYGRSSPASDRYVALRKGVGSVLAGRPASSSGRQPFYAG